MTDDDNDALREAMIDVAVIALIAVCAFAVGYFWEWI